MIGHKVLIRASYSIYIRENHRFLRNRVTLLPRAIPEVVSEVRCGHSSALPIIPCHTSGTDGAARERRGVGT